MKKKSIHAPTLSPPAQTDSSRISMIDALRGFALLGIIIAHMIDQYYAGILPKQYFNQTVSLMIDKVTLGFSLIMFQGKFYAIFSFLFGVSFYLQVSRKGSQPRVLLQFSWRLTILFLIGFLHHMHYFGDILTIYAMVGLILIISHRLPDKYLLILSLLFIIDIPGILMRIIRIIYNDFSLDDYIQRNQKSFLIYYETFKSGSYWELLIMNIDNFKGKIKYAFWLGRIDMTAGLFLLGFYIGRKRVFEDMAIYLSQIKNYLKKSVWGLLALTLFTFSFFVVASSLFGGMKEEIGIISGTTLLNIFNVLLATIYVCTFILLFQRPSWNRGLLHLYEVGRMGLTNYLLQTIFGLMIFSTIGFGLIGKFGATLCLVIALVVFALQIWMSKLWMKHFYYGPVEWLWRSLTALEFQALSRSRNGLV